MHNGTQGDVAQLQRVAGLNVRANASLDVIALLQAGRSEDVALLAIRVVEEGDAGRAVGVVLNVSDRRRDAVLVVTTEVNHAVLALMTAAAVAGGHATVVVTATGLVQRAQQRLLGGVAGDLDEVRDGREATARSRGLVLANSHCSNVPSVLRPDRRRCRWCPHAR